MFKQIIQDFRKREQTGQEMAAASQEQTKQRVGLATRRAMQTEQNITQDVNDVDEIFNKVSGWTSGIRKARETRDYDPYESIKDSIAGGSEEQVSRGPENASSGAVIEGAPDVFRSGGISFGGTSGLVGLIDKVEGAGNYNTLFGHAQREGKAFAGVSITEMTLDQLKEFTDTSGEYAQWVKQANPKKVLATPLGRYQFVGTTLREVAGQMGLSGDTKFTPETQDKMFAFYARQRLAGKESLSAKRSALRDAWDGFNHISNEDLNSAIVAFESNTSVVPQSRTR